MNYRLSASASLLALMVATGASAADLPRKTVAPASLAPASLWSGCYVGVNAGGAWGDAKIKTDASPWLAAGGFTPPYVDYFNELSSGTLKRSGFTGGGQVGCNWQRGALVYGVEADFGFAGLSKSRNTGFVPTALGGDLGSADSVKSSWLATLRVRLGTTVLNDSLLLYVTGGLAAADAKFSSTYSLQGLGPLGSASFSTTMIGWTAGVGAEYALNRNWSIKAEYLYVDLGNKTLTVSEAPARPNVISLHKLSLNENIARIGVNYRF